MRDEPGSILHLYRDLLAARRGAPALQLGSIVVLEAPDDVLVYERRWEDDVRVVAISFADTPVQVALSQVTVEVSSDPERRRGAALDGPLQPYEAALLHRSP
ncbi:MAG: DUF3459 domain-containing protein [Acidimicrobiales bacterium]